MKVYIKGYTNLEHNFFLFFFRSSVNYLILCEVQRSAKGKLYGCHGQVGRLFHKWYGRQSLLLPSYFAFDLFQSFIELNRIKKCFTLKGEIFILEEFGKITVICFFHFLIFIFFLF